MRHVTITCPNPACGEAGRAVGDPDEGDQGHSGKYYCFACKGHGTYKLVLTPAGTSTPLPAPPAEAA